MGKSFEQVMGARNLIDSAKLGATGIEKILPEAAYTPTNQVYGNEAEIPRRDGARDLPIIVDYGAASHRRELLGLETVRIKMVSPRENIIQYMDKLQSIFNLETGEIMPRQENAVAELEYQFEQFGVRFANLRTAAVESVLARGEFSVSTGGEFQLATGGAAFTVDYGVPAGNKGDVGGIIGAPWATASTPIATHVEEIKRKVYRDTRQRVRYAIHGPKVRANILNNTQVGSLLQSHESLAVAFAQNRIMEDFLGLTWIDASDAFFLDDAGAVVPLWADDAITFMPEINRDWWRMVEGSYTVPTGNIFGSDPMSVHGSLQHVFGMFGYSKVIDDPTGIKSVMGDNFLPAIANPKALVFADTTP